MMNVVVMIVVVLMIVRAKTMMMIVMIQPQSNTEMKRLAFNLVEIKATDRSVNA
jgi:hypothetical protein